MTCFRFVAAICHSSHKVGPYFWGGNLDGGNGQLDQIFLAKMHIVNLICLEIFSRVLLYFRSPNSQKKPIRTYIRATAGTFFESKRNGNLVKPFLSPPPSNHRMLWNVSFFTKKRTFVLCHKFIFPLKTIPSNFIKYCN